MKNALLAALLRSPCGAFNRVCHLVGHRARCADRAGHHRVGHLCAPGRLPEARAQRRARSDGRAGGDRPWRRRRRLSGGRRQHAREPDARLQRAEERHAAGADSRDAQEGSEHRAAAVRHPRHAARATRSPRGTIAPASTAAATRSRRCTSAVRSVPTSSTRCRATRCSAIR